MSFCWHIYYASTTPQECMIVYAALCIYRFPKDREFELRFVCKMWTSFFSLGFYISSPFSNLELRFVSNLFRKVGSAKITVETTYYPTRSYCDTRSWSLRTAAKDRRVAAQTPKINWWVADSVEFSLSHSSEWRKKWNKKKEKRKIMVSIQVKPNAYFVRTTIRNWYRCAPQWEAKT